MSKRIDKYDGQHIWSGKKKIYEIGSYLGTGASGSVYQGFDVSKVEPSSPTSEKSVAIKILKPLGFKLLSIPEFKKCAVLCRGSRLSPEQISGKAPLSAENVWWYVHQGTGQIFAAYEDNYRGQIRELTLPKCIEIWGWYPLDSDKFGFEGIDKRNLSSVSANISGNNFAVPLVAPKYLKWLTFRQTICREMVNMSKIGQHENVISLLEVLEHIEDTKATLFLVLEFVNGGELFERMKVSVMGTSEKFARQYFTQLLSGIEYCHEKGVVHRDLKPENLLTSGDGTLKIADFGLSAVVNVETLGVEAAGLHSLPRGSSADGSSVAHGKDKADAKEKDRGTPSHSSPHSPALAPVPVPLRRLKSVVGSPHYIAPEIFNNSETSLGYDGKKVDMWSAGVILFVLLTGNLPFGGELATCAKYQRFKKWMAHEYIPTNSARTGRGAKTSSTSLSTFPEWFFAGMSSEAAHLLASLLHIDPTQRISAREALAHPWCNPHGGSGSASRSPRSTEVEDCAQLQSPRSPDEELSGYDELVLGTVFEDENSFGLSGSLTPPSRGGHYQSREWYSSSSGSGSASSPYSPAGVPSLTAVGAAGQHLSGMVTPPQTARSPPSPPPLVPLSSGGPGSSSPLLGAGVSAPCAHRLSPPASISPPLSRSNSSAVSAPLRVGRRVGDRDTGASDRDAGVAAGDKDKDKDGGGSSVAVAAAAKLESLAALRPSTGCGYGYPTAAHSSFSSNQQQTSASMFLQQQQREQQAAKEAAEAQGWQVGGQAGGAASARGRQPIGTLFDAQGDKGDSLYPEPPS